MLQFQILVFFTCLFSGSLVSATSEDPVTFQSGQFLIPTLEQFETRVRGRYPDLKINFSEVPAVEWRQGTHNGLVVDAEGIQSGNKFIQKLTYVEQYPGLLKLVFVDLKVCVRGTVLNENQEWVETWGCSDDPFPLGGFHDLFIVRHANVDLAAIQPAFSQPIVPYVSEAPNEEDQERVWSLGDLRRALELVGSSMQVTEVTYSDPLNEEAGAQPGLQIFVRGQLSESQRIEQFFTYIIVGEQLRLKAIEGEVCRYVDRIGREICDPIYEPSPVTNLPLVLLNRQEPTGAGQVVSTAEPEPVSIPAAQQCGPLLSHHTEVMRVHFERSLFDAGQPAELSRFLRNFPNVADPSSLLFSAEEKQFMVAAWEGQENYEDLLQQLSDEFSLAHQGNCSWIHNWMTSLKAQALLRSSEIFQVMNLIKEVGFDLSAIDSSERGWTPLQREFVNKLPALQRGLPERMTAQQALDITLNDVKRYIEDHLERMSDLEHFTLAAMAQQDAYSQLIAIEGEAQGAILGHAERDYFGVSIATGFSGQHYVLRLHPLAAEQGLQVADQLQTINGQQASQLRYEQVDDILLQTDQPIDLQVTRGEETFSLRLTAQPMNPLQFFYDVDLLTEDNKTVMKISLRSFEPGVTQALHDEVMEILSTREVSAFVLDLRDNPGGNTDEAINLLSFFARDRVVAFSRLGARHVSELRTYEAKPEFFVDDEKPLFVQINGGTMSSSEIVASGYQALGRSITIGTPTFGKLVGQFYIPVVLQSHQSLGLLLTAFEFYTVTGRALNQEGVQPDLLLGEASSSAFDDGLGASRDLDRGSFPLVELYDFEVESSYDLAFAF